MTAVTALVLIGVSLLGIFSKHPHNAFWIIFMILMPSVTLIIASFFSIRGYELNNETLFVKRLGWSSKLDLSKLVSVQIDPRPWQNQFELSETAACLLLPAPSGTRNLANTAPLQPTSKNALSSNFRAALL